MGVMYYIIRRSRNMAITDSSAGLHMLARIEQKQSMPSLQINQLDSDRFTPRATGNE